MATAKIEIEKGVPLTPPNQGSRSIYPFSEMEVGDSFFVPGITSDKIGNRCAYYKLKWGKQFSVRKADGGVRVWRTK